MCHGKSPPWVDPRALWAAGWLKTWLPSCCRDPSPRLPLAPAWVSAAPPWASTELWASALRRVDRSSLLLTSLNLSYLLSPNTGMSEAKLQAGTWQGRKLGSVQQPVPQHLWVVPAGPGGGTWRGSRTGHTLPSEGQLAAPVCSCPGPPRDQPGGQAGAARGGGAAQGAQAAGTAGPRSTWAGGRTAAATREFHALAGAHLPSPEPGPCPPHPKLWTQTFLLVL